jgi:phenylpropionate dioxygenase-like ring-hydroxylating dioxygenase large terminal subunit
VTEPSPLNDSRAFVRLPLLRRHWYVAGLREEFGQDPLAKILLERSIVFYRKVDGALVALQNRCAHRAFPLSEGTRVGDHLRCGYHGLEYDERGDIVDAPSQATCPRGSVRNCTSSKLFGLEVSFSKRQFLTATYAA